MYSACFGNCKLAADKPSVLKKLKSSTLTLCPVDIDQLVEANVCAAIDSGTVQTYEDQRLPVVHLQRL